MLLQRLEELERELRLLAGRVCSLCGAPGQVVVWAKGYAVIGACGGRHADEIHRIFFAPRARAAPPPVAA